MGRSPDTAAQQQAKGNPRRNSKAVAAREARAKRLCELLTPRVQEASGPAVPELLQRPGREAAVLVWKWLAPELERTNRLPKESVPMFAAFCIYYADWLAADIDIAENGWHQRVTRTNGTPEDKRSPAVAVRQQCFAEVKELSARFGLTPLDSYDLFRGQAAVAQNNPGLFDRSAPVTPERSPDEEPPAPVAASPLGAGKRYGSTPPPLQ